MMVDVYHVNFHTFQNHPIFLDEEYAGAIATILEKVIEYHAIVCVAWTVMPTHIHLIVLTFPDQTRGRVMNLLKGASSRAFFDRYPEMHGDLGGRLWQEGYDWVRVASHEQYLTAIQYVQQNRARIGLAAPPTVQTIPG